MKTMAVVAPLLIAAAAHAAPKSCPPQLNACKTSLAACELNLSKCTPVVFAPLQRTGVIGQATSVFVQVSGPGAVDWKVYGQRPDGTFYTSGHWYVDGGDGGLYRVTFVPETAGVGELRLILTTSTAVQEYPIVVVVP